jgi:hypothetical protein
MMSFGAAENVFNASRGTAAFPSSGCAGATEAAGVFGNRCCHRILVSLEKTFDVIAAAYEDSWYSRCFSQVTTAGTAWEHRMTYEEALLDLVQTLRCLLVAAADKTVQVDGIRTVRYFNAVTQSSDDILLFEFFIIQL